MTETTHDKGQGMTETTHDRDQDNKELQASFQACPQANHFHAHKLTVSQPQPYANYRTVP